MPPEESYIAGDLIQYLGGDGERGSGGERASPRLNQVYDRVLQNLAVHFERGNLRRFSEGFKNRIGDSADAGLKGQEAFGYAAGAHVGGKKFGDMAPNRCGFRVARRQRTEFIDQIRLNDAGDLLRRHDQDRTSDPVRYCVNMEFPSVRRILGLEKVVQSEHCRRMTPVELDQHLFGSVRKGVRGSDGSRENNTTARRHIAGLDNGPMDRTQ